MTPIAYIFTDFPDKFGVPRQSGLAPDLVGKIVFEPEFRSVEAVRELDGFSHIWLLWEFSKAKREEFQPTVRPPRLGGNRRVGVFASRSPFRPNSIGLSAVKIIKIDLEAKEAPVIYVSGADTVSGTPIFDIKPYIPLSDCIPNALEGYTAETKEHRLKVIFPEELLMLLEEDKRSAAIEILALDPRPSYIDDGERVYGAAFAGKNIKFTVEGETLKVTDVQ